MTSATRTIKATPVWQKFDFKQSIILDRSLMWAVIVLASIGWLMVTSASMDWAQRQFDNNLYISIRHGIYLILGAATAFFVTFIPLEWVRKVSGVLILLSLISLLMVVIPGIGREVNGSMRWVSLGFMNVQPSEFAKLATVLYMASYLERRRDEVQSKWSGFIKPLFVLALLAVLLLLEPDFGAVVVLMLASLALLFLGGVKASQFILTAVVVLGASILILLSQPYRLKRLTGYWEPWTQENVYGSGYQLTQSLIAFGRGEFSGVGLGNSIQKLFYLPEAHTDFVFAIWSEETGLLGAALIIGLFVYIFMKAMKLGRKAYESQQYFPAFVAYGMGLLIGFQGFINLGVNMGLLPTKGLTLPFVSYGGSSLIACFIALGLLLRVHHEMESLHGKK
ncbi:putative lipid II flippase FtsW [Bermanella sp. WJH001]|uniref:putative lipid II flippase FtsW n=1 Tax=Bermanella sp. WJH001 TaxID=3048005 RepID=UPI0024BEC954|nr:putative lipid II flippase FtsW [Bermanella sp. WJH001]MDJ1537904.1 putative lipid II flippase FtsW [Bermanella sp. WJH001]